GRRRQDSGAEGISPCIRCVTTTPPAFTSRAPNGSWQLLVRLRGLVFLPLVHLHLAHQSDSLRRRHAKDVAVPRSPAGCRDRLRLAARFAPPGSAGGPG